MFDPEAPRWLIDLVTGRWGESEWKAWREVWKPQLGQRGVTPDMLRTGGGSPDHPLYVAVDHPGLPWCSAEIRESDGDNAVLHALGRLIDVLDEVDASRRTRST